MIIERRSGNVEAAMAGMSPRDEGAQSRGRSKIAGRRAGGAARLLLAVAATLLLPATLGETQSARPRYRVGVLWDVKTVPPAVTPLVRWLAEDLAAQGLTEGAVRLIVRQGEDLAAFQQGARELLRERVDVIWASTTAPALAAKAETSTVPIVFGVAEDADQVRLVDRLGRPGGNVTGVSIQRGVVVGKRLELLKALSPRLRRVLLTVDPESAVTVPLLQEARTAARQLNLSLIEAALATRADVEQLPALIRRERVEGVCHIVNAAVNAHPHLAVAAIDQARIPDVGYYLPAVERGWSLAAYAPSHRDAWRTSARLLARILRGARPDELPVESPDILELHVNLQVARQRGIPVPPAILTWAHRIFE